MKRKKLERKLCRMAARRYSSVCPIADRVEMFEHACAHLNASAFVDEGDEACFNSQRELYGNSEKKILGYQFTYSPGYIYLLGEDVGRGYRLDFFQITDKVCNRLYGKTINCNSRKVSKAVYLAVKEAKFIMADEVYSREPMDLFYESLKGRRFNYRKATALMAVMLAGSWSTEFNMPSTERACSVYKAIDKKGCKELLRLACSTLYRNI